MTRKFKNELQKAGFLNIGALFHSTTGENQTLMKYRKESQIISILDDNQSEIQDSDLRTPDFAIRVGPCLFPVRSAYPFFF